MVKSEAPGEPSSVEPAGKQAYTTELKEEGRLGLFLSRDRASKQPHLFEVNVVNYHKGISQTLRGAMYRLLSNKTEIKHYNNIAMRIHNCADLLADGCSLITYLKLRSFILIEIPSRYTAISLGKPKVSDDLPIPAPFAFAIQQFGAVNVADLHHEKRCIPVFPSSGHKFGLPTTRIWNPNAYAQAVEFATGIGLRFNVVDPMAKNGTAWWLLMPVYAEDIFELRCVLPEVNYSSSMALTQTLFFYGESDDPSNPSHRFR